MPTNKSEPKPTTITKTTKNSKKSQNKSHPPTQQTSLKKLRKKTCTMQLILSLSKTYLIITSSKLF